jgi:uncharacterized membrane protein
VEIKMAARYLLPIGIGLVFLGIILIIIASLTGTGEGRSKVAVGGIIGFIPFGFGTDKKLVWFVMILTAAIFFLWIMMSYLWR